MRAEPWQQSRFEKDCAGSSLAVFQAPPSVCHIWTDVCCQGVLSSGTGPRLAPSCGSYVAHWLPLPPLRSSKYLLTVRVVIRLGKDRGHAEGAPNHADDCPPDCPVMYANLGSLSSSPGPPVTRCWRSLLVLISVYASCFVLRPQWNTAGGQGAPLQAAVHVVGRQPHSCINGTWKAYEQTAACLSDLLVT